MKNPLKFSLHIKPRWVYITALTISPGLFVSLVMHNPQWLVASFLAMAGILPYSTTHSSRTLAFLNIVVICLLAYLVKGLFFHQQWALLMGLLVIMAIVLGYIDNTNSHFRSLSTWMIIGCVYGGVKLNEAGVSGLLFIQILLIAIISVSLVLILVPADELPPEPKFIGMRHPQFIFSFKYVLPIIITTFLWNKLNVQDPEWFIWSSLTVVLTQYDNLFLKYMHRIIGVTIGAGAGMLISLILPHSILVTYLCFLLTSFSLRSFKDYLPAHILRCFVVVVFAGNVAHHSLDAAFWRFSNVILGGTIGFLCTILLLKLQSYLVLRQAAKSFKADNLP
jgi:uncharacterized membrane protein YccC